MSASKEIDTAKDQADEASQGMSAEQAAMDATPNQTAEGADIQSHGLQGVGPANKKEARASQEAAEDAPCATGAATEASATHAGVPATSSSAASSEPAFSSGYAPTSLETKTLRNRRWFYTIWTVVGAILLTGVAVYLLNILSVPVSILIWTVVIVFCLRGTVNTLERHGVNRVLGTTLAYVLLFAVLAVAALLMFSPMLGLSSQFSDLISRLPTYAEDLSRWSSEMYDKYSSVLEDDTVKQVMDEMAANISGMATSIAQGSANGLIGVGTTVANGLMAIGFALVIAFWILMELPRIGREVTRLIGPAHSEDARFLHLTFTRVMGGYIKGTLLQCAIIGVGCSILFAFTGIPNAAALGGITGVLNIIPIIGPWLGGIAAAVTAMFTSPLAAVIAVVGTVMIQQFVYTFVSPKIMANSVDVHPAITLFALMVGSALGGAMSGFLGALVGMLVSIPAVAVMKSLFVYYFEKRTGRRLVAEDGVFFKGTPADPEAAHAVDPLVDATSPHPATQNPLKKEEAVAEKDIKKLWGDWRQRK